VRRDATLQADDLRGYGLDSPDALYDLIYAGRGAMPGFGEGCAPRGACTFAARLADDDVRALAAYVLERAGAGWAE
jgi:cytochrome c6